MVAASFLLVLQFGVFSALHSHFHQLTHKSVGVKAICQGFNNLTDDDCPVCTLASISQSCQVDSFVLSDGIVRVLQSYSYQGFEQPISIKDYSSRSPPVA